MSKFRQYGRRLPENEITYYVATYWDTLNIFRLLGLPIKYEGFVKKHPPLTTKH